MTIVLGVLLKLASGADTGADPQVLALCGRIDALLDDGSAAGTVEDNVRVAVEVEEIAADAEGTPVEPATQAFRHAFDDALADAPGAPERVSAAPGTSVACAPRTGTRHEADRLHPPLDRQAGSDARRATRGDPAGST